MDDELKMLEEELGRLRPAAASPELKARIAGDLGPRRRPVALLSWLALPAAAAAGAALLIFPPKAAAPAAPSVFKPVAARQVLLSARDEGYEQLDGVPAHRLRATYVDSITWENPAEHASLTWSVPREQVRVIPASFQ
jgi:hypothetical protein